MKTNRRGFFGALAAAAGAVLGIKAAAPGVTAYAYRANGNLFYKFDYGNGAFPYPPEFHKDAFSLVSPHWDMTDSFVNQFNAFYGFNTPGGNRLTPEQRQFNPARLPA